MYLTLSSLRTIPTRSSRYCQIRASRSLVPSRDRTTRPVRSPSADMRFTLVPEGARGWVDGRSRTRRAPRPARISTCSLTSTWSIWLCGRCAGHVRPRTERRQPGSIAITPGPQKLKSPATTAGPRCRVAVARRSACARAGRRTRASRTCGCRRCRRSSRRPQPCTRSRRATTRDRGTPRLRGSSRQSEVGRRLHTASSHEPAGRTSPGRRMRSSSTAKCR